MNIKKFKKVFATSLMLAMGAIPSVALLSCSSKKYDLTFAVRKEQMKLVKSSLSAFTNKTGISVRLVPLPQSDSDADLAGNIEAWYASGNAPDIFISPSLGQVIGRNLAKKIDLRNVLSNEKYFLDKDDKNISNDINWNSLKTFAFDKENDIYMTLPGAHNTTGFAVVDRALDKASELKAYTPQVNASGLTEVKVANQATADISKIPGIEKEGDGRILASYNNIQKFINASALISSKKVPTENWYGQGMSSMYQRIYSVVYSSVKKSVNGKKNDKFNAKALAQMTIPFSGVLDLEDSKYFSGKGMIDSEEIKKDFTGSNSIVNKWAEKLYYGKYGYVNGDDIKPTTNKAVNAESQGVAEGLASGYSNAAVSFLTWQKSFMNNSRPQFVKANTAISVQGSTKKGNEFKDLKVMKLPFISVGVAKYAVNKDIEKDSEKETKVLKLVKFIYEKEFQKVLANGLVPYNDVVKQETLNDLKTKDVEYSKLLDSGNFGDKDLKFSNGKDYPGSFIDNLSTKGENNFWWHRYVSFMIKKLQDDQANLVGISLSDFKNKIVQRTNEFNSQ